MTQPRQDQERDEAAAPAYVWVHGDDTTRTTWSACLNDPLNGVGATNVDLFDDGRVAGIETMGGPATPQELLAVIRFMRWHTAVDEAVAPAPAEPGTLMSLVGIAPGQSGQEVHFHHDEGAAVLAVVARAREWRESIDPDVAPFLNTSTKALLHALADLDVQS